MSDAASVFKQHFGYTPTHVTRAPGSLELLGHPAARDGLFLSVAIDQYLSLAASPRSDGKIALVSAYFPGEELFWISDIQKNPAAPWADGVKGVLLELRRHGAHFGGFNAAIHSTIPLRASLGASAALQAGTLATVRKLYPFKLTETGVMSRPPARDKKGHLPDFTRAERYAAARACLRAGVDSPGREAGFPGALTPFFGKRFHVLDLDGKHQTVEWAPLLGPVVLIRLPSGVMAEDVAERGGELRHHCAAAAQALGAPSLRAVEPAHLKAQGQKLSEREYACAYHVVGEIQRVAFAGQALRHDDFEQFGQYLFQSHESSRDFFRNSCAELDLLVELAQAHPGCLGARLTGPGFGGATINLVAHTLYADFMEKIPAQYERHTGRKIQPMICLPVDGVK